MLFHHAGLVMRIKDPKATATMWKSGKVGIMGAASVGEARRAARKFKELVQQVRNSSLNSPCNSHLPPGANDSLDPP